MFHVLLDLYGCPSELLADEAFLRAVLSDYPRALAVEVPGQVELRYIAATSDPDDAGCSGLNLLRGHVSLLTRMATLRHGEPRYLLARPI